MPYKIKILNTALKNIDDIADYTLEEWGEEQMRIYIKSIFSLLDNLKNNPLEKGTDRSHLSPNLRSIMIRTHYHIFYRVNKRTVEVIRILHTKSNWSKVIKKST